MSSGTPGNRYPRTVASVVRAAASVVRAAAIGLCLWACGSSPGPAAYSCKAPPAEMATCSTADDCTTVTVGCYCGAQPVNGVALKFAATAQSCEDTAASTCALGCATEIGMQAQDGNKVTGGATIAVRCEPTSDGSGICKTYVP